MSAPGQDSPRGPEPDPGGSPRVETMFEKLTTIAIFEHPIYAYLSKTKLDSNGIECLVTEGQPEGIDWLHSEAACGFKLKVRESDAQRAIRVLRNEPGAGDELRNEANAGKKEPCCPSCHSSAVECHNTLKGTLFAFWLLLGGRRWRCRNCGHKWK